jgi:hypothetical protein
MCSALPLLRRDGLETIARIAAQCDIKILNPSQIRATADSLRRRRVTLETFEALDLNTRRGGHSHHLSCCARLLHVARHHSTVLLQIAAARPSQP